MKDIMYCELADFTIDAPEFDLNEKQKSSWVRLEFDATTNPSVSGPPMPDEKIEIGLTHLTSEVISES